MPIRVKICGITNRDDALAAVDAGADALGFMLYEKSKRSVTPDTVAEITQQLPPFVARVGVFVNESATTIEAIRKQCQLDTIQLHGDETPEFCHGVRGQVIKAFRLQSPDTLALAAAYQTSAWLLDSYSPAARGGTGERFNWDWIRQAKPLDQPIIIAGGLSPDNVAECIATTQPFGLDVSSGVESAPGKKDAKLMRRFIDTAQQSAARLNTFTSEAS